jgi:hypothetical protein
MRTLVLATLLSVGPAMAEQTPAKPSSDPNPVVKIEGDTLTYIGGTNEVGLRLRIACPENLVGAALIRAASFSKATSSEKSVVSSARPSP